MIDCILEGNLFHAVRLLKKAPFKTKEIIENIIFVNIIVGLIKETACEVKDIVVLYFV